MKKIYLMSLGCPKNLVDSEYLLGLVSEQGWQVCEEAGEADIIAVNTCGFIQAAVEESIASILEMAELKGSSDKQLVVLGCLPQRYGRDLAESLEEVDLFWGTGGLDELARRICDSAGTLSHDADNWAMEAAPLLRPGFNPLNSTPRLRSAPFYRAFLKISEGCSNACSYCMIPRLRGPLKSRPLPLLIEEAAALAEAGVKELILVAQDTTAYGLDLKNGEDLPILLKELAQIDGFKWVRVMYAYPSGINDKLIEAMADAPKICRYLDLPLQHAAPDVLKRMKRKGPYKLSGLIERLRKGVPGLALRTTMMVGFPGETEEEFQFMMDFVRETRFDHLGVFKFSIEDGIKAADYTDQVRQTIKENRRRKLMALQRSISKEKNKEYVGKTVDVLVEGYSPETDLLLTGRTERQAPEIDGQVYITSGMAAPGDIVPVVITESHDYDLVGEIVEIE